MRKRECEAPAKRPYDVALAKFQFVPVLLRMRVAFPPEAEGASF